MFIESVIRSEATKDLGFHGGKSEIPRVARDDKEV